MALFAGDDYDPERDDERLASQLMRVRHVMKDAASMGRWITVREIATVTRDPQPSVLAQIGHLRKTKHGQYQVWRQIRPGTTATYEYLLGDKGAGTPRRHTCKRSEELEDALRELDPYHPLLADEW